MKNYRAIPIDGKDFVYGWYAKFGDNHVILDGSGWIKYPEEVNTLKSWKVIPETVGQQVGQLDKNKKEIYKGDKVKSPDGLRKYVVAWSEKQCRYYLKGIDKAWTIHEHIVWEGFEIIGNIHSKEQDKC